MLDMAKFDSTSDGDCPPPCRVPTTAGSTERKFRFESQRFIVGPTGELELIGTGLKPVEDRIEDIYRDTCGDGFTCNVELMREAVATIRALRKSCETKDATLKRVSELIAEVTSDEKSGLSEERKGAFIGTGIAVEDAIHDLDKAYGESIAQ